MKTLLRLSRNAWLIILLLWSTSLLVCWLVTTRVDSWQPHTSEALIIISAFYLLVIVLRQYQRIRTEHHLQNLVQREVDRSLAASSRLRDQQVVGHRLERAITLLRAHRSAGGGGSAALHDLPWYLVIGEAGAGKTSLLSRAGLSATVASDTVQGETHAFGESSQGSAPRDEPGTAHCDWYLSPEAVMIDTAGQYLQDEQSVSEFGAFLRLLKKHRGCGAINGLVLVVNLPALLTASAVERRKLAARLVARVESYADCLQACPPIYLMLSKTDHIPGFTQAFMALDDVKRQQPLGMTFGVGAFNKEDASALLKARLGGLQRYVQHHVDHQILTLNAEVDSTLVNFPSSFAELGEALQQLLEPFAVAASRPNPLLLRGLYFTSALQTGEQLRQVHEESISEAFALEAQSEPGPLQRSPHSATTSRSYFITDTFRHVLFADRNLALHHWRRSHAQGVRTAMIGLTLACGLALIGWQSMAFKNNRQWLEALHRSLDSLWAAPDRGQRLASGEGLERLRIPMAELMKHQADGTPSTFGAGLYQGSAVYEKVRKAYLEQLRRQALEPITLALQLQLRQFNELAAVLEYRSAPGSALARPSPLDTVPTRQKATPLQTASLGSANQVGPHITLPEAALGRLDQQQASQVINAYDALKLYLVLTQPLIHPETDFVAAALPAAWAHVASGRKPVNEEVIRANTFMYQELLRTGQALDMPRNQQLVNETRNRLKGLMISSSLVDREYLRMQMEAGRRLPALSLADLVPLPGRALLAGDATVAAIFTRQGWESFVKPELITLASNNLHKETDWVLDGEADDRVMQKAKFVDDFLARYKKDYAEAWYRFISDVRVRPFNEMTTAIQQLSLLSDLQHAPVKALLEAINENTQWDLPPPPAQVPTRLHGKDSMWDKVSGVFDSQGATSAPERLSSPELDNGSLAKRFEPIARLFAIQTTGGADSAVMDQYLANLRKLKVRLVNIQRSQDVGKGSRLLISETLAGKPSEITEARNYVESAIETSQSGVSGALKELFTSPIQYAWEALSGPAAEQIDKAWAQQIARPWEQMIAHRYPLANGSDNEASVKDLQRFLAPETGLLPSFKRNEIGNLASAQGMAATAGKARPLVDPAMVAHIDKASAVGEVIASLADPENGFEVMLQPSAHFTDIILTLDGQIQHYRNGKAIWERFIWPGTTRTPGARLEVITLTGERLTVFDYPGRWGLLRMSDSARVANLDGVQQQLSWNTPKGPVSLIVRNYGGVKLTELARVKTLDGLSMARESTQ